MNIDELHIKKNELISECLKIDPEPTMKNICHYTTLENGYNILSSKQLWLNDIRYLNDPNELYNGLKIYFKIIEILKVENRDSEIVIFALRIIQNSLIISLVFKANPMYDEMMEMANANANANAKANIKSMIKNLNIFIVSFCSDEKEETLRHWIHYGDNGNGVRIHLKGTGEKEHHFNDEGILFKVCYAADEKKESYASGMINEIIKMLPKKITEENRNKCDEFIFEVLKIIIMDCIASKSISYKDENEWRLAYIDTLEKEKRSHEVNYRVCNNLLIPYIKGIFIKNDEVDMFDKITLGPLVNTDLNKTSFNMLLSDEGYNNSTVEESLIRYRGSK